MINQKMAIINSLTNFDSRAEIYRYSLSAIKSLENQDCKDTPGVSVAPMLPPFSRTTLMPLGSRFHWVTLSAVRSWESWVLGQSIRL